MIISPLARPLTNHFERSGFSGASTASQSDKKLSRDELEFQGLLGGDCSKFGSLNGLLFLYTGEDENGNCRETVINMHKPELEVVQERQPDAKTAAPKTELPSFLIAQPAA